MIQAQEISKSQNNPTEFQENLIPTPLKALMLAVAVVAAAALGFLLAGLGGLAIGALLGSGLGIAAIVMINNFIDQPQLLPLESSGIEIQALTDVTDPILAQGLVDFYKKLSGATWLSDYEYPYDDKPQFKGSINDYARDIQIWMQQSEKVRNKDCLDLSRAALTKIPKEIALFRHLKKLKLYDNQLQDIPPEIGRLHSLTDLDLSCNPLRVLPSEIGNLRSLKNLCLNDTQLQALPPEISNLHFLTTLHLYGNPLRIFPPEILDCNSLTKLYLGKTQLKNIPGEIGNLHSLTILNLAGNQIRVLPREIGGLHSLTVLDLSRNQLQDLPFEICNLHFLECLNLDFNNLQSLPPEIVNLRSLTDIFHRGNPLQVLPPGVERFFFWDRARINPMDVI